MSELKPQILAVTLDGWPGMSGQVRLDLGWERTVLVGKNGAGKSVVLESFVEAARVAYARRSRDIDEQVSFECEIGVPGRIDVTYRYEVAPGKPISGSDELTSSGAERGRHDWSETCRNGNGVMVWSVRSNELTLPSGRPSVPLPKGIGLLGMFHALDDLPAEAQLVRSRLASVQLVRAGVPRVQQHHRREFIFLKLEDGRWQSLSSGRTERLAIRIGYLYQTSRDDDFVELKRLVERLGLARRFEFDEAKVNDNTFGWVNLDGVNIGQVSDGTLRVLEVLVNVLARPNGVICIEEPETGIHPGLLERLLGIVTSYSHDRQIVVSTHSPYVVRWCDPADLRLVERVNDTTTVRTLDADEVDRVEAYLRDEGTLDSYIFEHSDEE